MTDDIRGAPSILFSGSVGRDRKGLHSQSVAVKGKERGSVASLKGVISTKKIKTGIGMRLNHNWRYLGNSRDFGLVTGAFQDFFRTNHDDDKPQGPFLQAKYFCGLNRWSSGQ